MAGAFDSSSFISRAPNESDRKSAKVRALFGGLAAPHLVPAALASSYLPAGSKTDKYLVPALTIAGAVPMALVGEHYINKGIAGSEKIKLKSAERYRQYRATVREAKSHIPQGSEKSFDSFIRKESVKKRNSLLAARKNLLRKNLLKNTIPGLAAIGSTVLGSGILSSARSMKKRYGLDVQARNLELRMQNEGDSARGAAISGVYRKAI